MVTRRDFLLGSSALVAAGALGACSNPGDSAGSGSATRHGPPRAKLTDIDHVVILMQENRSFDHYFGARPNVLGFADPDMDRSPGGRLPPWAQPFAGNADGYLLPWHIDTTHMSQCITDPDHSWGGQHDAYAEGRMDGFARVQGAAALGYHRRVDLPYHWALADAFTLCDHSFCSVLGPTNPNRYVSMTGTNGPGGKLGGPQIDNDTSRSFEWETYPERLQRAGVSWRIYHEVDDYDDNVVKFFRQFQGLPASDPLHDAAILDRPADAFEQDAAAGNLPQVSWIVAPEAKSEHPSFPPALGEHYAAAKIGAVLANPKLWAKTVFIVQYDENGGFADHVRPPIAPPGTKGEPEVDGRPIGLGFRVPTLVVSPWSRSTSTDGRVASDVFDHTSALRLLETRFGVEIPNLSAWRRETCGDLATTLDLSRTDRSVPDLPLTAARDAAAMASCSIADPAQPPARQVAPTTSA